VRCAPQLHTRHASHLPLWGVAVRSAPRLHTPTQRTRPWGVTARSTPQLHTHARPTPAVGRRGARQRCAGLRPDRRRQDGGRRVRGAPGAQHTATPHTHPAHPGRGELRCTARRNVTHTPGPPRPWGDAVHSTPQLHTHARPTPAVGRRGAQHTATPHTRPTHLRHGETRCTAHRNSTHTPGPPRPWGVTVHSTPQLHTHARHARVWGDAARSRPQLHTGARHAPGVGRCGAPLVHARVGAVTAGCGRGRSSCC
jgi:hypothetical protein